MKKDQPLYRNYSKIIAMLFASLMLSLHGLAINYVSNTTAGAWATNTSWLPVGIPTAADDVTILPGHTITMNGNPGACNNLTVSGTLTYTSIRTLNVSGNLLINSGGAVTGTTTGIMNVAGTFTTATGTVTIGALSLTVSTTGVINGTVVYTSSSGTQVFNGAFTMNNGAAITYNAARTTSFNGGVLINGAVTIAGSSTGTLNIGTNFNIPAGSSLSMGSANLNATAPATIGGSIIFTNATGTKTLRDITINAGGVWDCSAVDLFFVIGGSLVNNGTFYACATPGGANEYRFTSAMATVSGPLTIPRLHVTSSGTLTNTNDLTITDSLYGAGKFVQGVNANLYYNSPKQIVVGTFNPSAINNVVDYNYPGAQTIYGATTTNYYNLNLSNTGVKSLGNTLNVLNDINVLGTTVLDANAATNRTINIGGSWTINSSNPTPFMPQRGTVNFTGTTGLQTMSTVVSGGHSFYNLGFNNTSTNYPGIATTENISVTHNTVFTLGNLDLRGRNFTITGDTTSTTDNLKGGSITTSIAGSTFKVTDPNNNKLIYYFGTQIGDATNGITISDTSGRIQFQNFTQYGNAVFVKTKNIDDVFGGGNVWHGPVTFTAAVTASRWRFGDNYAAPDTFYNATFNAFADSGSTNLFIIGANSMGNAFYGTTTITSNTVDGVHICRENGGGNASARFYGPVIANLSSSGSMTFANCGSGNINQVTFDSTIVLNSTPSSTGSFYFSTTNAYGTIIMNPGAQFAGGSINGKTNVYLSNVTQLGTKTQTINTAGSTGGLYIGGATTTPGFPCTFNGPCNFTSDTAAYLVGSTFHNVTNLVVNNSAANGYIIGNTMNSTFNAVVGCIRFQRNTFNGTAWMENTAAVTSTSNGGNTFNGVTTIINSGTGILRQGGHMGLGDAFNSDVTFVQSGPGAVITPAYNVTSTFAGNISVAGSTGAAIVFGTGTAGNVMINGSGTQIFNNGALLAPQFVNLTIATTAATNILQFNFSPRITTSLTLTQGLVNLNNNTLTLGTGTSAVGTLNYTAGWVYGGTFTRWMPKTSVAIASTNGLFPVGTDASQNAYHPLWFGYSSNLTTAGTLSVRHTPTVIAFNAANYVDASWANTVRGVSVAAWQVTAGNGLVPATNTAQLRYGGNGFPALALADVNASLASSTVGTYANGTNANVALEVNRTGLTLANLNNTWYIGTRDISMTTLPLQLLSFEAHLTNESTVALNWTTASERDIKSFIVEKSADGVTYTTVLEVAGGKQKYNAVDQHPYSGRSYYRLRTTEYGNQSTVSRTVAVNVSTNTSLRLYPNPAHTNMQLSYNAGAKGSVVTRIVIAAGKVVATQTNAVQAGLNTIPFNVAGYPKGAYFLQVLGNADGFMIPFTVY